MICGQLSRILALAILLVSVICYHLGPVSGAAEVEETKLINVLALLPFEIPGSQEQPSYTEGPILLPSAELAVDQINQQRNLLPGFYMNLTVANSACNLRDVTVVNFIRAFFHSGVNFAGMVGPACSGAAEMVSAITGERRVSILNFHIVSSPRLTNRTTYGYSFGTVGSSHGYVGLFLHLMRENEWQSVAVLYEESKIFYVTAYSLLIEELPKVYPQGRIVFSEPISETNLPLSSLADHHVRVIFALGTSTLIERMMCMISRDYPKLKFPAYQFVFMEVRNYFFHYSTNFTYNGRRYVCSAEEITRAMEGYLLSHTKLDTENSTELVSGITFKEYFKKYQERVKEYNENSSTTEWANPTYDGVWSLALALNNSIPKLNRIGLSLSNYSHGHQDATNIIRDEVVGLQFEGASGTISFNNETGYANSTVDLHQLVDNISVLVGYYSEDTETLTIVDENAEFVENSFDSEELLVHPALATVLLLLTAIALTLIIIAHVITLVYRNFSSIRASSYRLGQLIFIGCYIVTLSIVCFTVQKAASTTSVNITSLCVIQVWCLPLGFTLILGTMTAKTWRLYRIFVHLKKPGKLLTDWVLIIFVLLLVGIDVILLIIWTAAFPFTTKSRETTTSANRIQVQVLCDSDYYFAWFGTLVAYQGLIMFTAFIIALLTKNIRHESFKTKAVTILVYFLTITLLLGMPTYLILQTTNTSDVNAEYTVLALTLNLVLYLCFVFLFFPPILSLLRMKLFPKVPGLNKFAKDTKTNSYHPSSFVSKN